VSLPPSPYCHHQAATVPSESVEPEPSNETATFVTPVLSGPAFATGATSGRVVLVVDVEVLDDVELVLVVGRDVEVLELVLVVVGRDVDVDVELEVEEDVELDVEDELLDDVELDVLVVDVVGLPPLAAQTGEHASSTKAHALPRRISPPGRLILRIRLLCTCGSRLRRRATEQGMCRGDPGCFPGSPCPHHQPPPHLRQAVLARSVNRGLPSEIEGVNATEVVARAPRCDDRNPTREGLRPYDIVHACRDASTVRTAPIAADAVCCCSFMRGGLVLTDSSRAPSFRFT